MIGQYQCRGWDTFGIWKYINGIAKNHPNNIEIEKGIMFLKAATDK